MRKRAVEFHHIGGHGAGMRQSERCGQFDRILARADRHKVMVVDGGVDRLLAGVLQRSSIRSCALPGTSRTVLL